MATFIVFGNLDTPFKRMADAINAMYTMLPKPVVIQAGSNIDYFSSDLNGVHAFKTCSYEKFTEYINGSELVIIHGGVGASKESILTGLRPAVFVRKHSKGEHIDDHQADWCDLLFSKNLAACCEDESDLKKYLESGHFKQNDISVGERFFNCDALKGDLYKYINNVLGK